MQMERASTRIVGNLIHLSSKAKTRGRRMLGMAVSTLFPQDQNCKVEFIQPSNWLYSVPNLLVFQHLVTLYLGGIDVRVVSEIE